MCFTAGTGGRRLGFSQEFLHRISYEELFILNVMLHVSGQMETDGVVGFKGVMREEGGGINEFNQGNLSSCHTARSQRFMFGVLNGPHLPAGAAVIEMLTRATRTRGGGANKHCSEEKVGAVTGTLIIRQVSVIGDRMTCSRY